MNLAHGGKTHGLFHGEGVVVVESRVAGVWSGYHSIPIEIQVHMRVSLHGTKASMDWSQSALQMDGVIIQLPVSVSDYSFFFLKLLMHVYVSDESMIINGVEGDVNLPVKGVITGEGGEVHGVGDQGGGVGSHERSGSRWPSVWSAI